MQQRSRCSKSMQRPCAAARRLHGSRQEFSAPQDTWRPLPHTFNAQKGIRRHHPQLWRQHWHAVAVVHYTDAKPWQEGHSDHAEYQDLVQLWWRVFHSGRPALTGGSAARGPPPPAPSA